MQIRFRHSFRAALPALVLLVPALMGARGCDGEEIACPANWDPVCGTDGVTYGNACAAEVAGATIAYDGECGGGCVCTEEYAPVCGIDGLTYSNDCFAGCAGMPIAHDGECESACACPDIYAPVCGADGVTYENECAAECAGVASVHPGACECPAVLCDLYCEHGFERDPMTGCETCRCVEPDPTCVTDADCGMGTYCDFSECWAAGGEPRDPSDPSIPPYCAGLCRPIAPPPPDWCTSDAECGPGARCDLVECSEACTPEGVCFTLCHGVCVGAPPPSDRCLSDADCGADERCNTDLCLSLCDGPDTICPAVCAGVCEPAIDPPPPPPSCASDADCAAEEHCELYYCYDLPPACPPDDASCILPGCGGACVPDAVEPPPPPPACASDADCGIAEYCAVPRCFWEEGCPTDGVCLPIDPTDA